MTTNLSIYDPAVLTRTINRPDMQPPLFLLNSFFTQEQDTTGDRIYFDVERLRPRIAPFVAPHMPGRVVEEVGYDTNDFKPAYVKMKTVLSPKGALKRAFGEQIGGSLSPEERQLIRLNNALKDHALMLSRREEVMVSQALRTGTVTVSGDGFATVVVDMKRDASQTVALAGANLWSANTSDPMTDLENRAANTLGLGGGTGNMVAMSPDSWRAMRKQLAYRGELPQLFQYDRSSESEIEIGPAKGVKVRHIGNIGDFDIWTYDDTYLDETGTTQHIMPSGTVIGVTPDLLEGTRCYGVIEDEEAAIAAVRFFAKSWLEKDPSIRYLLSQSAPLTVPYRPNASWCMTVL